MTLLIATVKVSVHLDIPYPNSTNALNHRSYPVTELKKKRIAKQPITQFFKLIGLNLLIICIMAKWKYHAAKPSLASKMRFFMKTLFLVMYFNTNTIQNENKRILTLAPTLTPPLSSLLIRVIPLVQCSLTDQNFNCTLIATLISVVFRISLKQASEPGQWIS